MSRLQLRRTSIDVLVHARELKRTTNTGRLVPALVEGARLWVRGDIAAPLELASVLSADRVPLLLFPSDDARELDASFVADLGRDQKVQLFVPDGNWRQASKVGSRHPELSGVRRVIVRPRLGASRQVLRRESSAEGLATLQAVAYALAFLEGPEICEHLLRAYELKLRRTLEGRGVPAGLAEDEGGGG